VDRDEEGKGAAALQRAHLLKCEKGEESVEKEARKRI
jgi:hypothetical protein